MSDSTPNRAVTPTDPSTQPGATADNSATRSTTSTDEYLYSTPAAPAQGQGRSRSSTKDDSYLKELDASSVHHHRHYVRPLDPSLYNNDPYVEQSYSDSGNGTGLDARSGTSHLNPDVSFLDDPYDSSYIPPNYGSRVRRQVSSTDPYNSPPRMPQTPPREARSGQLPESPTSSLLAFQNRFANAQSAAAFDGQYKICRCCSKILNVSDKHDHTCGIHHPGSGRVG